MESEGLLQHYVKTELFTAYISNNSSSEIGCFMGELLFHKMQPPDPLLRQKNTFCSFQVPLNKITEITLF
jgi:hypothetical protein